MAAAVSAAEHGHRVTLLEHNEKLGKKIYITGKGRCNLTNASEMEVLFANVMSNRKFLYSAFYAWDNQKVIDFFEQNGMPTKTERGNRVFPVSDHASDVTQTLQKVMRRLGVDVRLKTHVMEIMTEEASDRSGQEEEKNAGKLCVTGVRIASGSNGRILPADAVIIATGGLSYPSTGSTGDGYTFARATGHRITACSPSLVPFETKEAWVPELQGLALKNISIRILDGKKKLYEEFGEMLFTHFGVSGPVILSASGSIRPDKFEKPLQLVIDLKPALDLDTLDKRILREFDEEKNKQFKNTLEHVLPGKLVPVIQKLSGIDPEKKVNEISKEERQHLVSLLKALPLTITGKRGWNEAIITKGGINVKDVNPSTMESKLVSGMYFAGEVLDLDALTGGYNLQIAWSTGWLAGASITEG